MPFFLHNKTDVNCFQFFLNKKKKKTFRYFHVIFQVFYLKHRNIQIK